MKGQLISAVFFTFFSGITQLLKISSNKLEKNFLIGRGTECKRYREEDTQYFSGKFYVVN